MAGYTRQSAAQIISGEVISASPINAEYNQLLAAFNNSTGHKHDGTAAEGPPIALIADADQRNKVLIDTNNDELEFYIEQGGAAEKQVSIKHQIIEPTADNDVDLGSSSFGFKDIHAKGTTNLVGLTVTGNLNLNNITSSSGTLALGSNVDIDGGNIDGTVIGNNSASAITGTVVTASTKFVGPIEGAVTGDVTGDVSGDVTGNLTGNVTANSGTSTFNGVTINGSLDMNAGTAATVTGLSAPTNNTDAATKAYVDTSIANLVDSAPGDLDTLNELAEALNDDDDFSTTVTNLIATKLPLAGGTMTGNITMSNSGKVTGLPSPSAGSDAANKTYADTKLALAGGTLTGNLILNADPSANLGAATKQYVDSVAGSNQQAATSAAQALGYRNEAEAFRNTAETHKNSAAASATAAANSFDSFDDIYLGAKSSAPSTDNDGDALQTGALYFDTTAGKMFVYDGSSFVVTGSAVNGTSSRQVYVATANQTTFAISHDVGFVDVYINGLKLRAGTDFTDNNVSNIALASGANLGDIVDIVAFGAFNVSNHYTQTQSDARYTRIANNLSELTGSASTARANIGAAPTANPTFTGTVTIPTSGLNYSGTTVTATGAELNKLAGATASTAELNKLTGLTASTAELNHVTGVTSAIQTQLDSKAPLASPNFSGTPQISGTNIPVVTGHIANLSAGANGSIPYQTSSNTTTFRAIGSAGQVLTVAGGVPTWADAAAGGTSNGKAYFFGAM